MKLASLPPEERPRERLFSKGPEALSLAELLAILLNTGAAGLDALELAGTILARYGTLELLAQASANEFLDLRGMGAAKAAHLMAALELARRLRAERSIPEEATSWSARLACLAEEVRNEPREYIFSMYLDKDDRLLREERLSFGGVDGATLDLAFLLRSAIRIGADSLVMAHNHPNGDQEASREDREMTQIVERRLEVLGIGFRGHYILAGGSARAICAV